MPNYLAFIHGQIEVPRYNSVEDGNDLGNQCISQLKKLEDPTQFPPRLLILLVSPAYLEPLKAKKLLDGVHHAFAEAGHQNVPLIGCSTAAVFFNRKVHPEGALLICLASKSLRAEVAVGVNATDKPERAIGDLLNKLSFYESLEKQQALFTNHTLFTLFPGFEGYSYPAPKLHKLLRDKLPPRTPIFGGVGSANDPNRLKAGIFFAGGEVLHDSIVAARVTTATPLANSLSQVLTDTKRILRVSDLSEDNCSIRKFQEGSAPQIMEEEQKNGSVVLLAEICARREPTVDTPQLAPDRKSIRLTREINKECCFRVMRPEPASIHKETLADIMRAVEQFRIEDPVGCFAFKCTGMFRHRHEIGMEFERELTEIENHLNLNGKAIPPGCVGAFMDGEAGVDEHGRSLFINWGTVALIFGDELIPQLSAYQGFTKFAELAKFPLAAPKESARRLLQVLHEIGFRGAMISFWMPDQQHESIVAQATAGSRYEKIIDLTHRPINEDDILAVVAREKRSRFVRDSRLADSYCNQEAIRVSGIVSQYFIPLKNLDGKVNVVLQFDLGDISDKQELQPQEAEILDEIGNIVGPTLNDAFRRQENETTVQLEQAIKKSASAETVNEGLQKYLELLLKALGLSEGLIRLEQEGRTLTLAAGAGPLYQEMIRQHRNVDFGEHSPLGNIFIDQMRIIINDAANNREHKWMCGHYRETAGNSQIHQLLTGLKSYANLPFVAEGGKRGTVCLFANDPWFFTWFHKSILQTISSQLSFLLNALQRKCAEKFLLGVTPRLSQLQNLENLSQVLAGATERFARAIHAQYASLFLLDEEQELYILRAQYGWRESEWINAARYGKDDVWTGSIALAGAPRYIPDLYRHYAEYYRKGRGHYNKQVFGKELSEYFTVETIGLPLKIAGKQIGVMVLYRRIKEGETSGFLTTDPALLPEAAANLTSLVKLVQANSDERCQSAELQRHTEIYKACTDESDAPFETRVCLQSLDSYRADSVDFYSLDADTKAMEWKAGARVNPQTQKTELLENPPAAFPEQTDVDKMKNRAKASFHRKVLNERQMNNPQLAATVGVIERVYVPLFVGSRLIGLLDLKWRIGLEHSDPFVYRHSPEQLKKLGEMLGAAYQQYQLAKSREELENEKIEAKRLREQAESEQRELKNRNDQTVKATGAYIFQGAHRMQNFMQKIYNHSKFAKLAGNEGERNVELNGLEEEVEEAERVLKALIDKGERLSSLKVSSCNLALLVKEALKDGNLQGVSLKQEVPEDLAVDVDSELTKEVFINVINNSTKAMSGRDKRELTIAASAFDSTVTLLIKDTGKGMTEEELQAAMRGFVATNDHKGVGVLISQVLLDVQGGTLKYRSFVNMGTETIITLPLAKTEN